MDELFGKTNKKESDSSKFLVDEKYKGFPETKPSDQDKPTTDGKESGSSSSVIGGVRPRRRGNALLGEPTSSDKTIKSSSVVDDLLHRFAKTPIQNRTLQTGHEEIEQHVSSSKVSSKTLTRKNEGEEIQITDYLVGSSPSGNNVSHSTVNYANFQQTPATTSTYGDASMFSLNNEKLIHEQSLQMDEFESQQQQKFQQDLEEQRRILEKKQNEYKVSYVYIRLQ